MATVTKIPATLNKRKQKVTEVRKRKVAGYARVSTDHEEQASSFEAQNEYYTNYIQSRDDWEFVGMYSDDGITATSTKHRAGFNQMVEDALAGKIDLIITKSVSRFARNTVDSLVTVRKLKEKGIEIYFEKENIWTLDAKGELLITIMSSLAQEESRSISENTTWGHRKKFADGQGSIAFGMFLGYDKGENGEFVVNHEQAVTVKLIYKLFLSGLSFHAIAKELTNRGIKTPGGKDKWYQGTVESILTNEKYKGDALLQKYYTSDFLTKKQVKNSGEIPQYYVEGHHEAIIPSDTFDLVQAEILRRKGMNGRYSGVGIFSSKIKCGECGSWYGSKVWHSTSKYRKVIFRCNHKFEGDEKCQTPHLTEEEIKTMFIKAANEILTEKEELIANTKLMMQTICDTSEMEKNQAEHLDEMNVLVELTQKLVDENARTVQNQTEYQERYDSLANRYESVKAEYEKITEQINSRQAKEEQFKNYINTLTNIEGIIQEFDEGLWSSLIDYVTVYSKDDVRFTFKNGAVVQG
ncbi:MAG: recombinase family protein [Hespellia sp.]|nr:recombinase family protein [Hespellia sp.]